MSLFCTYCHKQALNPQSHTHGKLVQMEKRHDFENYEQMNFLQAMKENDNLISCNLDGYGTMTFYCPWCRVNHRHGITIKNHRHRVAHCSSNASPFQNHGYYLISNMEIES